VVGNLEAIQRGGDVGVVPQDPETAGGEADLLFGLSIYPGRLEQLRNIAHCRFRLPDDTVHVPLLVRRKEIAALLAQTLRRFDVLQDMLRRLEVGEGLLTDGLERVCEFAYSNDTSETRREPRSER
jgi:hypothetical protein